MVNINDVLNWQDKHMITSIILYSLIVAGLAYASYLKHQLKK